MEDTVLAKVISKSTLFVRDNLSKDPPTEQDIREAMASAVLLGVADASRKCRAVLLILAVPMVFGPLAVVNPIGPRCLYIPYMLLVTLMLTLLAEVYDRFDRAQVRQLRIPLVLTAACVLSVYLWTAVWNGHCEQVRTQQIQNALHIGICFLSGQTAVIGTEGQVEGNALLALGDTGTGVDVEQTDRCQDFVFCCKSNVFLCFISLSVCFLHDRFVNFRVIIFK